MKAGEDAPKPAKGAWDPLGPQMHMAAEPSWSSPGQATSCCCLGTLGGPLELDAPPMPVAAVMGLVPSSTLEC